MGSPLYLPDLELFICAFVRKEAVLSSQIEGTQSSLSDLLLYENEEMPGVPIEDAQEVSNYVSALYHGIKRLREGFPLSLRLIREMGQLELFLHEENTSCHCWSEPVSSTCNSRPYIRSWMGAGRLGRLLITFLLCSGGAARTHPVSESVLQD